MSDIFDIFDIWDTLCIIGNIGIIVPGFQVDIFHIVFTGGCVNDTVAVLQFSAVGVQISGECVGLIPDLSVDFFQMRQQLRCCSFPLFYTIHKLTDRQK